MPFVEGVSVAVSWVDAIDPEFCPVFISTLMISIGGGVSGSLDVLDAPGGDGCDGLFCSVFCGCSSAMGTWRRVMSRATSSRACFACANFALSSLSERSAAGGGECLARFEGFGLVGGLVAGLLDTSL